MNWHQFWESNKSLGLDEATRRFRKIEEQQYQEDYAVWQSLQEAKGAGSNASGAVSAGGGGSAVGTALFAPVVVADASPNARAVVFYWGTIVHANQYVVQRATDAAFTQGVTTIYTGNSPAQVGVPGFVDGNLPAGGTFYYRAKAQDTTATYLDSPYGPVTSTSVAHIITSGPGYGNPLGVDNL